LKSPGKSLLILLVFGCFLSASATAQAKPTLLQVRYWTAPDHTRIVLDLSAPAGYRERLLQNPPRIAIDVENLTIPPEQRKKEVQDGLVKDVTLTESSKNLTQVVIELARESKYKIFSLPKIKDSPDRIVLDVFREAVPEKTKEEERAIISLKRKKVRIVVVDAGHGGEDPGAIGYRGLKEKDVCLALARRTADEINRIPGYKAFLTRDGDYFLPLRRRTEIARERQADIFVSIHANACRGRSGRGTEIYFLSLTGATDEEARELAKMENAADLIGGVPEEANDELVSILYDLRQNDTLRRSSGLAESVVDNVRTHAKLVTRGVRQAGFTVLKSPAIPSVLVETAFITDKKEANLLKDPKFQKEFASLLAKGLVGYFQRFGPEASRPATHIVQKGETLRDIANAYGVTVQDLMSFNNLRAGAQLSAGQELVVFP
jgi:N-acetylmuramoyl-L-alanine amidase